MNKLAFTIISFCFATLVCSGQYALSPAQTENFNHFFNTKTYVVLTSDREYNEKIKVGMEKYWTHSNYDFIGQSELYEFIQDKEKSFVLPLSYKLESDNSIVSTSIIGVINGGKKTLKKYGTSDLIGLSLIDNTSARGISGGREFYRNNYAYRVDHMVGYLNDAILLVKENNMRASIPKSLILKLNKVYQGRAKVLKNKTLLIEKEIFEKEIIRSDFRKEYGFKYEVVSKDKIVDAFNSNDEKYCVLLNFKLPNNTFFIASCNDAKIVYTDSVSIGIIDYKKISGKQIKKLRKAILR